MTRRCDREGVAWPRTARDAADAGVTVLRWWDDAPIAPTPQWWDVSDPLHARERHIMAAECDEHIRCTRTPALKDHLQEPTCLPWPKHPLGGLWPGEGREVLRRGRWLIAKYDTSARCA